LGKAEQESDIRITVRRQHPIDRFIADFYCAKIKFSGRGRWEHT